MSNQPLSEQYRLAAKEWVGLQKAADLLEDTKNDQLAALIEAEISKNPDLAHNAAERKVRASEHWQRCRENIANANEAARTARIKVKWIEMRFQEWQSYEATKRAEMKL